MVIEYCVLSVESKNDSSGDNKKTWTHSLI